MRRMLFPFILALVVLYAGGSALACCGGDTGGDTGATSGDSLGEKTGGSDGGGGMDLLSGSTWQIARMARDESELQQLRDMLMENQDRDSGAYQAMLKDYVDRYNKLYGTNLVVSDQGYFPASPGDAYNINSALSYILMGQTAEEVNTRSRHVFGMINFIKAHGGSWQGVQNLISDRVWSQQAVDTLEATDKILEYGTTIADDVLQTRLNTIYGTSKLGTTTIINITNRDAQGVGDSALDGSIMGLENFFQEVAGEILQDKGKGLGTGYAVLKDIAIHLFNSSRQKNLNDSR